MKNLKHKVSYKFLAIALSAMLLVAMVPGTVFTSAVAEDDSAAYDYLTVQNLTADYQAEDATILVSWDAVDGDVDAVNISVDGSDAVALAADATSYVADAAVYAGKTVSVTVTAVYGEESRSANASVLVPATLAAVGAVEDVTVANNTNLSDILGLLPDEIAVQIAESAEERMASVTWTANGITYNKAAADAQTFAVYGLVALPEAISNPDEIDLNVVATVHVGAYTEVSIRTDLDAQPIAKKSAQSLHLSVEAEGTVVGYQWYKDDAAIDGACTATLSIESLHVVDSGSYYCVILGKNGSQAISQAVSVLVSNDTAVSMDVDPIQGQVRPQGVILNAVGIPTDAQGTLTFMANDAIIGEVTLPETSIHFYATGESNLYELSVIYSGDNEYNGSTSVPVSYNFNKGTILVAGINGMEAVAGGSTQLLPSATLDPVPDEMPEIVYTFEVSDDEVAAVDANGLLQFKKEGNFVLTVTANAGDDYNIAATHIAVTVVCNQRGGLSFEKLYDEVTAGVDFRYPGMNYTDFSKGGGDLVFSIIEAPSQHILIDQNGVITFSEEIDAADADLLETLTGDVVVCLTKESDGVYEAISATYTLTIKKSEQKAISFPQKNINITYAADQKGNALTTGVQVITGGSVNGHVVYSTNDTDLISVNEETGEFVAKKPGVATITATLPGNSLYNDISCTYTVTIGKGDIEGFAFAQSTDLSTGYGKPFTNAASGGQANADGEITYTISDVDKEIAPYVNVTADGKVIFTGHYALAADKHAYRIEVTATKAGNDWYKPTSISYSLVAKRFATSVNDFRVNNAEIINGEILSHEGWYNAEANTICVTPYNGYTKIGFITANGIDWAEQMTLEPGKHTFSFYLMRESGEVSMYSTQNINYDETGASATIRVEKNYLLTDDIDSLWDLFTQSISFDLWKEAGKKVTVEAVDDLSGIASIEYCEQNENFQNYKEGDDLLALMDGFRWTACDLTAFGQKQSSASFEIALPENTNKKVVIFVKVTDIAGNVTYFRSNGMVFDNVSPTPSTPVLPNSIIDITLPEAEGTVGLYNDEVPFTLTVNDEQSDAITSGIKTIKVTISGVDGDGKLHEKIILIEAKHSEISSFDSTNIGDFKVNDTFVVPASFDCNHLTILVEVEDYAGNRCSNKNNITRLAIDRTAPTIDVYYHDTENAFSNGKYIGNNQNRLATITITDLNFNPADVDFDITLDGVALDVQPNFVCTYNDLNNDPLIWQAVIDFADYGEGEYTFDIAYTDLAGNENKGWVGSDMHGYKNFIIDNTKPVIHVTISNANVSNDTYFSDDRVATITITERNFSKDYHFDWSDLTCELDGEEMPVPMPQLVSSDDETYVRVYTIRFTNDGDYTFGVKYTDLANNQSDGFTCNAVAYDAFTIDKTAPTLNISGVEDKSANNGVVAPVITMTDINIDRSAISVALSGVNNGDVNYTNTSERINNGQIITYKDFEHIKKVDDIYTLSVQLTDMAGNTSEKTITFSANRFGSVYDLSAIQHILDKFLQKEIDIVFTETNVDALDHESLLIKVIKNGTPSTLVEGTDYTIEKVGGDGQWSVYKYTIKKELFAADGRYNVTIYSEDAAGNVNENTDEVKEAEITFGIDKTAPVVLPVDLENGEQYPVDSKTATVEIKDNLVLDGVKIYLNGKEVEYAIENDTYSFDIEKSNQKQKVEIVAVDAAGNEQPIKVINFLVNANFFVRWYNNTPLFIGSIAGVVVLILLVVILLVFGKKKDNK